MAKDLPIIYPNNDDEIDNELAKYLYESHCAILIIENLPVASEFGIDLSTFEIGDKFKGVKLIPPGLHFVYASSINRAGDQHGPRCSFYYDFGERQILIKRWSTINEDFDESFEPTEELRDRYRSNLRDLDRYLGAYRFSSYTTFSRLTDKITPELLARLMPDCRVFRSIPYLTREESPSHCNKRRSQRQPRRTLRVSDGTKPASENELLPQLKPACNTRIKFTLIPHDHSYSKLTSQTDITNFNLDSTTKLKQTFGDDLESLLGELQMSYITLILGHVYESFEQWRRIIALLCLSDTALVEHKIFFLDFLSILELQLDQVPVDLFEDIEDEYNFIRYHLDIMFQNIEHLASKHQVYSDLIDQAAKLRTMTESKFKWKFGIEVMDELPTIVEL